ncbi:helix-turn-helix domain-containing protein [Sporosarcina highlanderae]|uniref:XRE family transcriptional regulator n=1 Tax=Sporosarcina highlanderae TaxID=3035916 RepID=A0ABT8JTA9_9BACL|nr:XRE family transcriptional regulator [Sporosarcina highlanderae]MDN4608038.1 XRE family transcriptional regulator [Sporosarcina highlanderae]
MALNHLGEKIKRIRLERGMTLKILAEKTGFSISFLSQLERGKSSATLESLKKISIAFGVNPSYLFEEERVGEDQSFIFEQRMDAHQIYYKDLGAMVSPRDFAPLYVVLKPGQIEGNLITHKGQEFLYVIEGILTVRLEDNIYELNPTESIMLDSTRPHYWYNYTNQEVRLLCVSSEVKGE